MKKILLIMTLLFVSITGMAGEQEKKAVEAIETVVVMKAKETLNPYKNVAMKKVANKLKNKFGNNGNPSNQVKAIGGLVKSLKELANPQYTHKTGKSETTYRVIQWKSLKIDYKSKNSDLKFNFETNGKNTKFGLGMSF